MVFELQLFRDLVEHLDARRLEHVVEVAQFVGVGFEIRERREDLAGRDETARAELIEHGRRRACVRLVGERRGIDRVRGRVHRPFGLSRLHHR